MDRTTIINERSFAKLPFPHFTTSKVFNSELADDLLSWLNECSLWKLTETNFYTQYEFSLLETELPAQLQILSSEAFTKQIGQILSKAFSADSLRLVGITAHKLIDGFKMGIHNDFIGKEETHRLVIQLNTGWTEKNGGYLMLFNSKKVQDVSNLIIPIHNSGIGFEISQKSYHAVSTIYGFERYTLVYTFNID